MAQNLAGHPARAIPTLRRALRVIGPARPAAIPRPGTAGPDLDQPGHERIRTGRAGPGLATLERGPADRRRAAATRRSRSCAEPDGLHEGPRRPGRRGLEHLDRAVELMDHADRRPGTRSCQSGNHPPVHGDLARARADLTAAAVSPAPAEGRDEIKAQTQPGLSGVPGRQPGPGAANHDEVLSGRRRVLPAVVLLDRARVLFEAGLHREADETLHEAGELFRADRLFKDRGRGRAGARRMCLDRRRIAAARRLAGSARTRFRRRANDRWRRDAELVLLQADLAAGRPGPGSAPVALRLAEEFRADGLTTRARTAQLVAAEAFLQAGRPDQARESPAMAGPIRPDDPISARLHTRLVRASWAAAGTVPVPAARSGPACPNWPGTRPGSAAWTCRPQARSTAGTGRTGLALALRRPAEPACSPRSSGAGRSRAGCQPVGAGRPGGGRPAGRTAPAQRGAARCRPTQPRPAAAAGQRRGSRSCNAAAVAGLAPEGSGSRAGRRLPCWRIGTASDRGGLRQHVLRVRRASVCPDREPGRPRLVRLAAAAEPAS